MNSSELPSYITSQASLSKSAADTYAAYPNAIMPPLSGVPRLRRVWRTQILVFELATCLANGSDELASEVVPTQRFLEFEQCTVNRDSGTQSDDCAASGTYSRSQTGDCRSCCRADCRGSPRAAQLADERLEGRLRCNLEDELREDFRLDLLSDDGPDPSGNGRTPATGTDEAMRGGDACRVDRRASVGAGGRFRIGIGTMVEMKSRIS